MISSTIRRVLRAGLVCLFELALLSACGLQSSSPKTPGPTATLWPTATPVPITPTPRPADTGWQPSAPGIEVRSLDIAVGDVKDRVTLIRLSPAAVRFRVLYDPETPTSVQGWAKRTGAAVVVNAGYFTSEYETIGLTISEGEVYGSPYGDYAGMFAVTAEDQVSLRWLRVWSYDPAEPLRAAVQSFPMLIKPGGVLGFPLSADDGRVSRRTAVGQDTSGRILFAAASGTAFTLHEFSHWLTYAELGLSVAVNLDGGTSTGLWVDGGPGIDSLVPVPSVIVAERR